MTKHNSVRRSSIFGNSEQRQSVGLSLHRGQRVLSLSSSFPAIADQKGGEKGQKNGDSGRDRTYDLMLRRHVLYPTELRSRAAYCTPMEVTHTEPVFLEHGRLDLRWRLYTNTHAQTATTALKKGFRAIAPPPPSAPSAEKKSAKSRSRNLPSVGKGTYAKAPCMAVTDLTLSLTLATAADTANKARIQLNKWCSRTDSNCYALRHWFLRPACLPIPPREHEC